jgi:hypothetical protein
MALLQIVFVWALHAATLGPAALLLAPLVLGLELVLELLLLLPHAASSAMAAVAAIAAVVFRIVRLLAVCCTERGRA